DAAQSTRRRAAARGGIPDSKTDCLLNMSPMNPDSGPIPESRIPNSDSGRVRWWRTLEERADDPAFQERLRHEFPSQIESISDPVERRAFLRLMGASLARAGGAACTRQPAETIVPYVRQPEELVPGRPLFFATAMAIGGVAT